MSSDFAQAPMSTGSHRGPWLLVLILMLAVGLRLPGFAESVWIDELYTSRIFCGDPIILLKTLYSDIHPPAYFVFIHFWSAVFGDAEVWLRLPPLLFGLGSIWLVCVLGKTFGGRGVGYTAALLMALSPVHIWYSQEARPYSANVFLLLLTYFAYVRLLEGRRRIWWWLLFLGALSGTVFTHYYMAVFLGVFGTLAVFRRHENRGRVFWACVLVTLALVVYIGAKWYFSTVPTSKAYLRAFDLPALRDLFFVWFLTGNSLTPVDGPPPLGPPILLVVFVFFAVFFVRGVYCLAVGRSGSDTTEGSVGGAGLSGGHLLAGLMALPIFLFVLTLAGFDQTYIERSALPSLPFFWLVLATGLARWRNPAPAGVCSGIAIGFAVVVLTAFYVHLGRWTVYKPNPDWRAATELISTDLEADDRVLELYSDYVSPTPLTYYDPRMQEVKNFDRNDEKVRTLLEKSASVFGTEGFPGATLRSYIEKRLAELDAHTERAKNATRVRVHELARQADGFLAARRDLAPFWLLVHGPGNGSARAEAVLKYDWIEVLSEHKLRWLTLYKLRRRGG